MIQKVRAPLIATGNITGNLIGTGAVTGNTLGNIDNAIRGNSIVAGTITGNLITYETASIPPVGGEVFFGKLFYFHGTPIAVGNELSIIDNSLNKLPLLYLLEIIHLPFFQQQ